MKVAVEITEDLIREHGEQSGRPTECPGYYALLMAGVKVYCVWYDEIALDLVNPEDGLHVRIPTPPEFEAWQRAAVLGAAGVSDVSLAPLSFEIEIPDELVPEVLDLDVVN